MVDVAFTECSTATTAQANTPAPYNFKIRNISLIAQRIHCVLQNDSSSPSDITVACPIGTVTIPPAGEAAISVAVNVDPNVIYYSSGTITYPLNGTYKIRFVAKPSPVPTPSECLRQFSVSVGVTSPPPPSALAWILIPIALIGIGLGLIYFLSKKWSTTTP